MKIKQAILGSSLGRLATRSRAAVEMLRIDKEALGTLANDQLAEHFVTRLCAPSSTFLDVGAHIGSIIAQVAYHCPGSKIIAVEAIPEKALRLRSKFKGVEVHSCALGEEEGEVPFFIDLEQSGYSSLSSRGKVREIRVPMKKLDSLLPSAIIDAIKIDVEGAELGVLRGGEKLIGRSRPTIMFESGPGEVLGYTKEDLWSWLSERGYRIHVPNRLPHMAPPLSLEGFVESHYYPRRTTNYFAVHDERSDEIRSRARAVIGS